MSTHGTFDDELDIDDVEDVSLASHIILSVNMIERGVSTKIYQTRSITAGLPDERSRNLTCKDIS